MNRKISNRLILVVIVLLYVNGSNAQNISAKVDSLLTVLKATEDVSSKCETLCELTKTTRHGLPEESVKFGKELIKNAEQLPNSETLAKAYIEYAFTIHLNGNNLDSLKILAEKSLKISERIGYDFGEIQSNFLLGQFEKDRGSSDLAAKYYMETLRLAEKSNDIESRKKAAWAVHGLGIIKDNQGKHDESKTLFLKSLKMAEENDDRTMKFSSYESLGISEALNSRFRSGLNYFIKAKSMARKVNEKSRILGNMSLAYSFLGSLDSAEIYAKEAVEISINNGSIRQQVYALSSLSRFYEQQKNYVKWIETLTSRETLIKKLDSKKWNRSNHHDFYAYHERMDNHEEALHHFKLYKSANDSVINERSEKAMIEMEKKYESEKNKLQISEQKVEITKQNDQRRLLLVSFVLMSLLAGLTLWFMRKRSIKNKMIAQQREEINKREIEQLQKEKEILGMASMLEGQEAERSRIANDLHDGLGGILASVKAHFSMIEGEIKKLESINVYDKAQLMMDNACEEVRRISHNLMPPLLHSQGLAMAITNLVTNANISHKMKIQLDVRNMDEKLDETKAIFLYRITQEILNNIVKHADTKNVEIGLYGLPESVQLIIEDQGKGFDLHSIKKGLGLNSIKSRVDYLEGDLEIDSSPGKGTSISILIPN